jgi:hypothetical protein
MFRSFGTVGASWNSSFGLLVEKKPGRAVSATRHPIEIIIMRRQYRETTFIAGKYYTGNNGRRTRRLEGLISAEMRCVKPLRSISGMELHHSHCESGVNINICRASKERCHIFLSGPDGPSKGDL